MDLAGGTFAIGPTTGALTVHTGRAGFGAMAGHDLVIEVTRWSGTVCIDADQIDASTVEVIVDATSLVVQKGSGGAVPLLASNKSEIARTIAKVLRTKQHPEIEFSSTAVTATAKGFMIRGDLSIAGATQRTDLAVTIEPGGDPPRSTVTTTVVQTDFGIKPYSAMLGALRVRDDVVVHATVQLP